MSVDVSYNRRWWNNFFTTHNAALTPADFDEVTLTAPQNPRPARRRRLPGDVPGAQQPRPGGRRGRPLLHHATRISATRRTTGTAWTCRSAHGCARSLFVQARHQHRPRRERHLRRPDRTVRAADGPPAGPSSPRASSTVSPLRLRRAVADAGARPGQLHRAQGGRARQRHLPLAAQRAAGRRPPSPPTAALEPPTTR